MQDEAEEQLAGKGISPQPQGQSRPQSPRGPRNTFHRSLFISRISNRKLSKTSHKPPAVCRGGDSFTNYLSLMVFLLPFSALARVPDSG